MTAPRDDRWLVAALVASNFGPAFMFSGVAVALPAMGQELSMSAVELGLVETTFVASSTAFLLPAGKLADATGRRTLLRWSLVCFGLLALAIGLCSHGWLVLALRFVKGAGAALFSVACPAILIELVPPERRGRVFGAMIGCAYAGLACGPLAAGWLVEHFGWRSVFVVGGLSILLGAVVVWRRLGPRWTSPGRWVDAPSFALLLLGVCGLLAGTSVHEGNVLAAALIGGGVLALAVFVLRQRRLSDPLLDVREIVSNRTLRTALLAQALLYLNAYCSILLLSVFLQVAKGLTPVHTGLVVMTGAVVMAIVAPFAGRLADRVRPELVARAGALAVVVSSVLALLLAADASPWHVAAVLVAQGIGFALFSSPNMAIVLGSLPPQRSGIASALAAQSRGAGMFAGMALTGVFMAAWFGDRPIDAESALVPGLLRAVYVVLLATSVLGALVGARTFTAGRSPVRR